MEQERRSVIRWLLGGGFAASIASFLYPAIKFINPPDMPEASVNEVSGGKTQDLKPNTGKIVKFGSKPALLVRMGTTEGPPSPAVSPPLTSPVKYNDAPRQIWAPCHNGFYDLNGKV